MCKILILLEQKCLLAEGEHRGGVTDGRVPHVFALVGLVVVEELQVHPEPVRSALPEGLDGAQEDADGVAAANGVSELLQVVRKCVMVERLDDLHALKFLNVLVKSKFFYYLKIWFKKLHEGHTLREKSKIPKLLKCPQKKFTKLFFQNFDF